MEHQLLSLMSSDDSDAFHKLFTLYFPKVKYFIDSILHSGAVAEDLSQDIFVKLWEQRAMLPAIENINAYIYRMARNAAINYTKRILKRQVDFYSLDPSLDYTPSYEQEYYAKEKALLIELVVANMPEQRKRVFEMSRNTGLSNDEIATQLNISKKTVENHLNLALKEIKKAIMLLAMFFC